MGKIQIISVGKIRESWIKEGIEAYLIRMRPSLSFTFLTAKNDEQQLKLLPKGSPIIGLAPQGKEYTSEEFAHFLETSFIEKGPLLTFLIGGADGLPEEVTKSAPLMSLSKMTFPHQMCPLILVEQIYRALEITKGSPYHR